MSVEDPGGLELSPGPFIIIPPDLRLRLFDVVEPVELLSIGTLPTKWVVYSSSGTDALISLAATGRPAWLPEISPGEKATKTYLRSHMSAPKKTLGCLSRPAQG